MSDNRTLTLGEAVTLAHIISGCQQNARVGYLLPSGDVATGTMRAIGDANGCSAPAGTDARDMFVRITTTSGLEVFRPVADVAREVADTTFVIGYQS